MTKLPLPNYYSTTDLAQATAISLYHPIDSIDSSNPDRVEFVFLRNTELDRLLEAYWRDELKVSPAAYFYQLRSLKTRIREAR